MLNAAMVSADTAPLARSYDVEPSLILPEWFENLSDPSPAADATSAASLIRPVSQIQWAGKVLDVCEDEWIVQLTSKALNGITSVAQTVDLVAVGDLDVEVIRGLGMAGQLLVRTPGANVDDVVDWADNNPNIAFCEPNAIRTLRAIPDDPDFDLQWNLDDPSSYDSDIDAPEAWDVYSGSSAVVVAVIDSGVSYTHPDLAESMWVNEAESQGVADVDDDGNGFVDDVYGWDFGEDDSDPIDLDGHGTHVAGIIGAAGNNGVGVTGVNWSTSTMALKFFDDAGSGWVDREIEAINYATMMRGLGVNVRVINASFGEYTYLQSERDAIEAAGSAGLLVVAAAGNEATNTDLVPHYPSCYTLDNIISVAATNRYNFLWTSLYPTVGSNYGSASVDLAAPGKEIYSTIPGATYDYETGTSMAAPHVAGVAAWAWSMAPTATYQQVRDAIFAGVDVLPSLAGDVATGGRLNALGTIEALRPRIQGACWNDLDGDGNRDAGEAALQGRTVFLDLNGDGEWNNDVAGGPFTECSSDVPLAIIDNGTITSELLVSGISGAITDLNVTLDISHTWDSDLDVYLISPGGTRVELFTDVGSSGDNFAGTTLDDEAATPITAGSAPFSGSYQPEGSLASLDGDEPTGTWILEITDDEAFIAGTLNSWCITFTTTTSEPSVYSDANGRYAFAALAPDTYIVRELPEDGWAGTAPAAGYHEVTLGSGEVVAGKDFGSRLAGGEIHGSKFDDRDRDGEWGDDEPGVEGWEIYLDLNDDGQWNSGGTAAPVTECSSDVPLDIIDSGTITSELLVSVASGAITDLDVTLDISHTWDSDLDVYLISPGGTRVELFTDVGSSGDNFAGTTLDDEAATPITAGSAPFSGSYQPEGSLASLDGEYPTGIWLLEVTDDLGTYTGTLHSWCITYTTTADPEPLTQTSADGHYVFSDLAPGTHIVREVPQEGWEQTYPMADGTVYSSDFEASDGGWVPTATWDPVGDWEWGTPTSGPGTAFSGENVWATRLDQNYSDAGGSSYLSQTFDFTGFSNVQLAWQQWIEVYYSFDKAKVFVNGDLVYERTTSTATPDYEEIVVDLSAYDGLSVVEIVFELYATTTVNRPGWYIDDVTITGNGNGAGNRGWSVSLGAGEVRTGIDFGNCRIGVTSRNVFYNNSYWDDPANDPSYDDDTAIATDKVALLPGTPESIATGANYTSYSRGINGIMVDIAGLPAVGEDPIDADDYFTFKVGNNDNPGGWAVAPAPITVTVRESPLSSSADRVTIIWEDHAIRNQWLEVTVLANAFTGLADPDIFCFGNAVAEAGNSAADAQVTTTDLLLARNNPRNMMYPALIDFPYDYDRDQRVNATDVLLARNNQTNFLNRLELIDLSGMAVAGFGVGEQEEAWVQAPTLPGAAEPVEREMLWRLAAFDYLDARSAVDEETEEGRAVDLALMLEADWGDSG